MEKILRTFIGYPSMQVFTVLTHCNFVCYRKLNSFIQGSLDSSWNEVGQKIDLGGNSDDKGSGVKEQLW